MRFRFTKIDERDWQRSFSLVVDTDTSQIIETNPPVALGFTTFDIMRMKEIRDRFVDFARNEHRA